MDNILFNEKDLRQKPFFEVLQEVQSYISENFSNLIVEEETDNTREQLKNNIRKYLNDKKLKAEELSVQETIDKLYSEMTEFSVLNEYLDPKRNDIEEININAWNDVKVNFSDGTTKSVESFSGPRHCENIIRRLLNRESKMILDKSRPIVRGHLSKKIRITVMGDGVIDSSIGLASSIRIVNPKKLRKQDFIEKGTASEEMINTLEALFQNGVSMCITGETGSGKTTFMSYLLTTIPYAKRVFTIEEDVREFDLVVTDEKGKVLNNVVHTCTRKSDDPTKVIDQEKLLETAMTMNPDVICVAEMKGRESFAAQEAANTGHTVITTTHARGCRATYPRMQNLCRTSTNMDSNTLMEMLKDAFPVVAFIEKYEDNVRRIKEITECYRDENGNSKIVTLFKYKMKENRVNKDGKREIIGDFIKVNDISDDLKTMLLEKGVQLKSLMGIEGKEEEII